MAILLAVLVLKIGSFAQKRIQFMHDPVYVPSVDDAVQRMIALAEPRKKDLVLDLGAGNGKLVNDFARFVGQAVGYEIDPFLVWEARKKISSKHLQDKVFIKWQSFWSADVSKADIILLFMTASIMEKLEKKLRAELKPGCKVVSQRFVFPTWKPAKKLGDCYLYVQK